VHYVDQVDSPHPVAVRDWTGTRIPMHAVSSGLVLLAHLPPAEFEQFLTRSRERFTARTIVDQGAIRERVRRAQVEGVAWTRDEYAEGITSVAAAIADKDGDVVAAVHVHGPSYRFPASGGEAVITERVVEAAARITATLRLPDA
jgi:DNA-binding IclR family transcriptional regulator